MMKDNEGKVDGDASSSESPQEGSSLDAAADVENPSLDQEVKDLVSRLNEDDIEHPSHSPDVDDEEEEKKINNETNKEGGGDDEEGVERQQLTLDNADEEDDHDESTQQEQQQQQQMQHESDGPTEPELELKEESVVLPREDDDSEEEDTFDVENPHKQFSSPTASSVDWTSGLQNSHTGGKFNTSPEDSATELDSIDEEESNKTASEEDMAKVASFAAKMKCDTEVSDLDISERDDDNRRASLDRGMSFARHLYEKKAEQSRRSSFNASLVDLQDEAIDESRRSSLSSLPEKMTKPVSLRSWKEAGFFGRKNRILTYEETRRRKAFMTFCFVTVVLLCCGSLAYIIVFLVQKGESGDGTLSLDIVGVQ
mmetsp:Transcript_6065/g.9291  ORF Transcript_6065/g.9291 Transcript_6065/m.9291 type:complete len:369 (-) Transcript_6065:51-1157(-)|eukprot:CAMPEP_0178916468 /NCGR_PEP_ID=MMETSP0786-20121207/12660_1 /TAXON_ID=186022 /ORGANISM="Thalassionema frauenfeldii, Strain CCMP 1798" /LENGTH=368 /DNA_ID=CAMNT_0020589815 /DNA_START=56 /DNA_END=1162 /DNA_ORIENTATION=-